MSRLFTSESVTEGHPDKICDQISYSIHDALLEQDPHARVAVETMVTTGLVHVAGEVATTGYVDIPSLVRRTIIGIGYDSSVKGFDGKTCGVQISIGEQSADIAQGVDTAYESRTGGVDPLDKQRYDARLLGREEFRPERVEVAERAAGVGFDEVAVLPPSGLPSPRDDLGLAEDGTQAVDDGRFDLARGHAADGT